MRLLLIILLIIATSGIVNAGDIPNDTPDLILLHHFNNETALGENRSFFYDSSNNTNHGYCIGNYTDCPTYFTTATNGTAIEFNGSNNVLNFSSGPTLNAHGSEITIMIWIKSLDNYSQWYTPILKGTDGWGDYSIGLNMDDGWALFTMVNETGGQMFLGHYGASLFATNDVIFIAGTYNGTHATLYSSNTSNNYTSLFTKQTTFSGGLINNQSNDLYAGNAPGGVQYVGRVDEFAIFNRSIDNETMQKFFLYFQSGCTFNWTPTLVNGTCRINDTYEQTLIYTDQNSCNTTLGIPDDNGTITELTCDYCTSTWENIGTDCYANNTKYIEYNETSFCYALTGLPSDAPPINNGTWISCDYLTQNFSCDLSTKPYLHKKIHYTCDLPGDYECVNILSYGMNDTLQVNPQKKERSNPIISFRTDLESRETFTTTNGILNAYYTNKNLVAETPFIITTKCSDGNNTLYHQEVINPTLPSLQGAATWWAWIGSNAAYIIIAIVLLGLLIWLVGRGIRELKTA